jgi:hypothetical protein
VREEGRRYWKPLEEMTGTGREHARRNFFEGGRP